MLFAVCHKLEKYDEKPFELQDINVSDTHICRVIKNVCNKKRVKIEEKNTHTHHIPVHK